MKIMLILAAALPFCLLAESPMALAKIPKCAAWKLPKVDVGSEIDAEWHEVDYGIRFTNSVGERISVERYCVAHYAATEYEAVPRLDSHYTRCWPRAVRKMCETDEERREGTFWNNHYMRDKSGNLVKGSVESQEELTAWRITENICLLLSYDESARMGIRMYTFVLFDGSCRRIVAAFDYLPHPDMMDAILSVWSNPDAVNNVAAMYYNETAWTHSVDDDYVVRLLSLAAHFGSVTACENLVVLGKDRGWSEARIERWRLFAKACRDAARSGLVPKMELKDISEWPISFNPD